MNKKIVNYLQIIERAAWNQLPVPIGTVQQLNAALANHNNVNQEIIKRLMNMLEVALDMAKPTDSESYTQLAHAKSELKQMQEMLS